jgi:hypothetical protein
MTTHTEHKAGDMPDEIYIAENTLNSYEVDPATNQKLAVTGGYGIEKTHRYIRAALSPPVDGWRDIGTAPRDGTWCLYWDARYEDVKIARRGQGDMPQTGDWEYELQATHWMPLPQPPKEGV